MNHKCDTDEAVYFYEQEFYVLSNFSSFKLLWQGILFDTSEAAYHWEKFHNHPNLQYAIIHAKSAHYAFKLAEANIELRRGDWDKAKVDIMLHILRAKVEQHSYVKKKLLDTESRLLVEDSWRDPFWGWGKDGLGKNILGKLWMQVRDEERKKE